MKNLFVGLRYFLLGLWFEIKAWPEKSKRLIWNRGIKLQWNRLWVRKDEFHSSLNMDANAMLGMSKKQRDAYIKDLCNRRQIAHERDLAST
ncbi:hypothetical protein COV23_00400 [Candidatus Wolfebacteria bacterium CG10_big_fil_rev_8_21_14_0_10_31_9]|uniref:Uncharacterized protein n=1 Tax=Candidatus Wolfebacteria bacterium CG10_big_fil_rev_8_21_14_0_10_31_9 TaxID=1975070 RepID=A0A2H0RCU1_9BACT|nr:MAG: hypothetical protein COV23_00400 [Candidatus Wolfebacteria bacterium CG10_big_fil_rev_8_21_14_0_10_31_9]